MINKIIVNEMPEESADCVFSEMDSSDSFARPCIKCRVDGSACDLEYYSYCEKLMTFEDALRNIDIPEA